MAFAQVLDLRTDPLLKDLQNEVLLELEPAPLFTCSVM